MTLWILFGVFAILLLINVPVAFAVGVASMLAALTLGRIDMTMIVQRMFKGMNAFPLLAIILFIMAGNLLGRGGITRRLVNLAEVFVGRIPGGLALINVLASMFFGGVSGSCVADVSSEGPLIIPAMVEDGYSKEYATAITLCSATMGPIIPPSIPMIVYAHVAGAVSIAGLFLAGAIPGILIGLGQMAICYFQARKKHYKERPKLSPPEVVRRILDGFLGLFTVVIILGGILSGIFTATEAAAIAAAYAFFLTVIIYREIKFHDLLDIIFNAGLTTAAVLIMIATSTIFTWILTYYNFPHLLASYIFGFTDSKILILVVLNIFLLIVGMFIDQSPALVMLVPIIVPLANRLGLHPLHIGAVVVINTVYGLITPPVGTSLFVGCKIADIPMTSVIKPMMPFLAWMLFVLFLVTYVPEIVLFLPRLMGFA